MMWQGADVKNCSPFTYHRFGLRRNPNNIKEHAPHMRVLVYMLESEDSQR